MPLIKILDSQDGQFYSVIVAANGEIIYTSETETRKENVVKAARALMSGPIELGDFTTRKSPLKKAKVEPVEKPAKNGKVVFDLEKEGIR